MLEKNKDYLEMRVSRTEYSITQNEATQIRVDGCVYTSYTNLPDPGELCVFISKEKFERLQAMADIEAELAKQWEINFNLLLKKTGFDTVEELVFYLTNVAEADTLHEAISKLKNQVKYTCDEWYSANSTNNSWKAAAECNSPKELIEKLNLLRDDISGRSTVIESYKRDIEKWQKATGCLRPEDISTESLISKCTALEQEVKILNRALQEWKEVTKCRIPEAAKEYIESGMSWHHAYNEVKEKNRKLTDEIASWKHVTGHSTPEDYLRSRINAAITRYMEWEKATGCETPEAAKSHIESLENAVRLTNKNMQKELEREIDTWQKATGCKTPEEAETTLRNLRGRIDEIKSFAVIASNWTDRIVED